MDASTQAERGVVDVTLKPPRNFHECTISYEHRSSIPLHMWAIRCSDCDPRGTRCIYYLDERYVRDRAIRHEQGQGDERGTVMTL